MAVKTFVTEADYMAIEEQDGGPRYELDEGELVEMPSATAVHNIIRDEALVNVRLYLRTNPIAIAISETDVRLYTNTIRRPDILVFLKATIAGLDLTQLPLPVVPELVFEIISPSETSVSVERKIQQYERSGVKVICLIYPPLRSGVIHQNGSRREVPESGAIETDLLPGFSLKLSDLFAAVPQS